MVGLNFHDLDYPEPLASTLQAQIQQVIDSKGPVRAETPFGVGYYEYIFVPIVGEGGKIEAVAGTTRDITERKKAEEDLLQSQREAERLVAELQVERQKLRNLFEQSPAFIALLSGPEFIFEFANEDYYRLIGRHGIIGKPIVEALPEVEEQGFVDLLRRVFTTGETYSGKGVSVFLIREDGKPAERFVNFIYQAIKDATGSIGSILVHGIDVTEQVLDRREVERLNAELEERVSERTLQLQIANRELEGFTYSVSHDLRAPLRAIVSSSSILLEDHGERLGPEIRRELHRQAAAANKLAVLIDELLKLSRLARQEIRRTTVDLSEMAHSVAEEVAGHFAETCDFEIQPGMSIFADPTSLRLLLTNLLENACKFSPKAPHIQVGRTESPSGPVYWVKDNGVGFDMQYAAKVFLPFERLVTESEFPGTGIGLANVKRIVDRHGGRVWVETAHGDGATFYFTLS